MKYLEQLFQKLSNNIHPNDSETQNGVNEFLKLLIIFLVILFVITKYTNVS